jgi:hypothetical protein
VRSRGVNAISHGSGTHPFYHRPTPQVRGTFLKHINRFDNIEFGIGNKDGRSLVTATRKLVELSFLALQDSGIEYRGKKIGSFMCGTTTEYWTPVSALCPHPSRHVIVLTFSRLGDNKRTHRGNTGKHISQSCFICPGPQRSFFLCGHRLQLLPHRIPSRSERDKRRRVRGCFGWRLSVKHKVRPPR